MTYHKCVYKYSSTHAILVPSERVIRASAARVAKTCQILGKVETPGTQRTGCGVSLTGMSPESSYVNGFSTDLSLFDSLEIHRVSPGSCCGMQPSWKSSK